MSQDEILGALLLRANALASVQEHPGLHPGTFSAVPSGTDLFVDPTQDFILATLSRPFGTVFVNGALTQTL
jgi:hypothetical protein